MIYVINTLSRRMSDVNRCNCSNVMLFYLTTVLMAPEWNY